MLEIGFGTSIRREWDWRVKRGESLRNLEAFAAFADPRRPDPGPASRDLPSPPDPMVARGRLTARRAAAHPRRSPGLPASEQGGPPCQRQRSTAVRPARPLRPAAGEPARSHAARRRRPRCGHGSGADRWAPPPSPATPTAGSASTSAPATTSGWPATPASRRGRRGAPAVRHQHVRQPRAQRDDGSAPGTRGGARRLLRHRGGGAHVLGCQRQRRAAVHDLRTAGRPAGRRLRPRQPARRGGRQPGDADALPAQRSRPPRAATGQGRAALRRRRGRRRRLLDDRRARPAGRARRPLLGLGRPAGRRRGPRPGRARQGGQGSGREQRRAGPRRRLRSPSASPWPASAARS